MLLNNGVGYRTTEGFGSPTWIRTRDLRINSPSLYRLSYQGIDKTGIILSLAISVKD